MVKRRERKRQERDRPAAAAAALACCDKVVCCVNYPAELIEVMNMHSAVGFHCHETHVSTQYENIYMPLTMTLTREVAYCNRSKPRDNNANSYRGSWCISSLNYGMQCHRLLTSCRCAFFDLFCFFSVVLPLSLSSLPNHQKRNRKLMSSLDRIVAAHPGLADKAQAVKKNKEDKLRFHCLLLCHPSSSLSSFSRFILTHG